MCNHTRTHYKNAYNLNFVKEKKNTMMRFFSFKYRWGKKLHRSRIELVMRYNNLLILEHINSLDEMHSMPISTIFRNVQYK